MKKIDLHIHTIPTIKDSHFDFDISILKKYVDLLKIDSIAITNHDKFDIAQFKTISYNLNIPVFPGIEISLEKFHLLVISDIDDLENFSNKCYEISQSITNIDDTISLKKFNEIFNDLSKYILIPHYDKSPSIDTNSLTALKNHISSGEVCSTKKFLYSIKNKNDLVPVIFSDIRISEDIKNFPIRQTYIDLENITFNGIKSCLLDKNKVFLSKTDGHKLFQVLENGLAISNGLTVVLGERSSGKTYLLDKISNAASYKIKYIKQFSLLGNDEKNFDDMIQSKESLIIEDYLKKFKIVVEDILPINLENNEKELEIYIDSLIKHATEIDRNDSFSSTYLFNESKFPDINLDNLKKIIQSVITLIDNEEYRAIIHKYISKEILSNLIVELMNQYTEELEKQLKKNWLNELITDIQKQLQIRTAITPITEVNLYKFMKEKVKIEKFRTIVKSIQNERTIYQEQIQNFTKIIKSKKYTCANEMKLKSRSKKSFIEAYQKYEFPYEFLLELKKIPGLEESEYYKYFVDIQCKILNNDKFEISGGERSEYNLLEQINDSLQYDMLLIDEPESSFDNLFLKNHVNELIKKIAEKIPVVIVTHNNTVGASIKPHYIVYTKKTKNSTGSIMYKQYCGYPADKQLLSIDGDKINNIDVMLNCLEAGQSAYETRRQIYETIKD